MVSLTVEAGICAAVVLLSYLPLLVVKELDAPIRSRTVLAAYIGALAGELAGHKQVVLLVGAPAPGCWDELCRVTSELGTEYPMLSAMAGLIVREDWKGPGAAPENRLRVVARGTQAAAADTAVIDMGME